MTKKAQPVGRTGFSLTGDSAIGAAGGCLALGALTFGIYMNVHGPASDLGRSRDFTVFAQLAPRQHRQATPASTAESADLDTTSTATIPRDEPSTAEGAATRIIPSISLASAGPDDATLVIDGRARRVHLGDEVPGIGAVLAIVPGERPMVRTARGLIVPEAQ